ncbi:MAG: HNH endonuclease signature motif containing protein [Candidatus Eremiobacteraeota bacterium]|nr:HNH endonuclease signature motif containing protein [Candidatus Eremiobacteraeota bacterium]
MSPINLQPTLTLHLPDEEELLHLSDPCRFADHEDMLLLPEPFELPAESLHNAERMVKITREGLLPEAERLTGDLTFGPSLIDRDERASKIDFTLCEAVRGRLALDLVLGGLLVNLRTKGVDRLGYRSMATFAVEHLSMSGRTASELMHNFELLGSLPLTRKAYLEGWIAKSALRHLSRVATPENEAWWLERAQRRSLSGLAREVSAALAERGREGAPCCCGKGPEDQSPPVEGSPELPGAEDALDCTLCAGHGDSSVAPGLMMYFRVSPSLALTWDFALSFFRDREHYDGPLAGFIEALLANWMASHGGASQPSSLDGKGALPIFYREPKGVRRERERGERDLPEEDALDSAGSSCNPWKGPWHIFFPSWLEEIMAYPQDDSPALIAGRLIRGASIRQRLDAAMGVLLRGMGEGFLHERFGFASVEEYAEVRCGFSKAHTRQLIRLADDFRRRPLTEDAFKSGLITREQARLILPVVDSKNEKQWIAFAASVPTADLREEAGRIRRIKEYDFFAAVNYTLLPGFRYVTDDRFHALPEEVRDIIREGSWYKGPSLAPSWPLSEDDEGAQEARDRRFDAPWKYFSDGEELLAAAATTCRGRVEKSSSLCAGDKGLMQEGQVEKNSCLCARLEEARKICTLTPGANPEEALLVDILQGGAPSRAVKGAMTVKFYLPQELHELWNIAALVFLASQGHPEAAVTVDGIQEGASADERFLAALLTDYLASEGEFHKAARHHKILKRDRFHCQSPGCRCRRNLHIHHIIRRSQGGTDDEWNLIVLCEACHLHLLHGLRTLTVSGRAPYGLTVTFGSLSEGAPFLIYVNGSRSAIRSTES